MGFDTYVRLLEETVRELKGEEVPLEIHATLNLGLDIRIPADYIADENQRLRSYKRIADVKDDEQAARIREELSDRYGPVPEEVSHPSPFLGSEEPGAADRRRIHRSARRHRQYQVPSAIEGRPAEAHGVCPHTDGAQFTPAGVLKVPLRASTANAAGLIEELKNVLLELTTSEPVASTR